MAPWIDSIARRFGYAKPARRDFSAAVSSRLTGGWQTQNISANADLYRNLDKLRARSQDLCNNNDYAKRFLGMVGANVIGGTGIVLQSRIYDAPGKPDDGANTAVESAWDRWGALGSCDVTGRLSWRDLQNIAIKCVARDGEAMVRMVRGKAAGNPFGFALQLLDINRLDTTLIRMPDGGANEVKMGIELDSYGRAIAYWLRGYNPAEMWLTAGNVTAAHVRVLVADILHIFTSDRPEQVRGLPWMHAAMVRLNNLGGYEEAAVIAARVGASKMGFFTTPEGTPTGVEDGKDEQDVPFMEADAGSFGVLPQGYDFKAFDPDYPHAMYAEFVRACLRGIASGLGVSYHGLANDLTQVNFSSIRSGTLEERDQWIGVQEWFKDSFCEPVFKEWIKSALAFGQITLANGSPLPLERLEKFSAHTWQARRWQWVDPLKDMEANVLAVQEGFKSPQSIAAELGVDYEDVLVQIKQAQDLAAKIGVTLGKLETLGGSASPKSDGTQSDTEKAAKLHADAIVRVAEIERDARNSAQPTAALLAELTAKVRALESAADRPTDAALLPQFHITTPVSVAVDSSDLRAATAELVAGIESTQQHSRDMMQQIREDIQNMPIVIPAPVVNLGDTIINVEPTPVTLEATITPELTVTLPARRTETDIVTDGFGNIIKTIQTEQDA